ALTVSSTGVDSYAGGINGVGDFTLATGTLDLTTQNAIDLTGTGATTIDANATLNVMGTIAGTVIDNGTLGILTNQNIGNLSGSGAISITNLETLTITETGTSTFTGTISGLGGLTLNPGSSPGTLTFTNALSYTGETTIGSGATMILTGTSASSIGGLDVMTGGTFEILPNVSITDLTGGGTVSIGVGDTLTSTPSSPLSPDTFTGTIIGSGQFVLLGVAGTSLTLTGINTYSGGTTIGTTATLIVSGSITGAVTDDGGTFTVQNTFAITDLNGSGVINLGTTGNTLTVEPSLNTSDTFSGSITGGTGGGLTVDGSSGGTENSLVLTGDLAAYTGTTTIQNNGALGIEYSDNLGSTAAITFGTGNTTDGFLAFLGTGSQTLGALTLGGTDTIDAGGAGNTVTLNSTVTSSAGYKITLQNGTFILGTSASFSGWTGGTVQIGNVMGSGSSASSLPATLQFGAAPNIGSNPATIVFDDGTADYTGSGNTDLPDNINYVVDAAGGTVEITGTAAGTLTIAGTITDTTGGTLTFSGNTPNSSVPSFIITSDNSATLTSGTVAIGDAPTNVEISNEDAFGNAVVTVSDDSTLETSNFVAGTSAATFFDDITAAGYSQDSTSSLSLSALGRPTTGYDEFQLGGGAASLNGTLNLSFVAKPHDYDTYDIINTTGTVTNNGIFNNAVTVTNPYLHETFTIDGGRTAANSSGWSDIVDVNANTKTPDDFYLRFWETSTPGTGQQVIVQTLLSPFATNQSALDIAKYLDDYAAPGAISKPLQTALSNLSGQSAAAIANALNSMSVTDYAAIQQTAFQNSTFLNQQVFAQMANGFGGGGVNTSGLSIMNTDGAAPDPFSMALNSQLQTTEQSVQQTMAYMDNYNSWSVGEPVPSNNQGSSSTTESNVGATGFPSLVVNSVSMFVAGDVVISNTPDGNPSGTANYLTGGVLLGGGVQLDENWSVGGFFNWGYTGASLDNVGSHQQGNSYTPGLFVGYQNDGWYANGLLSYTYNTYRIDRNVQFGSASYTATGQPTSSEYNVSLLGGYNAQLTDNFSMGPSAGVTYTHVDVSSFSESGSPFDMNVASQSTDSCRTLLGFLGQWTIPGKNFPMPLDINFNAYWQHEFLNNSGQIAASMTGVNNTSTFVFQTSAPVRDSFLGGVGIGGHINKNVALFANYELLAGGQNLFGQSVIAGVAIGFK
ncbi:MAG TPA: autotransporter outer membrane beta-barrel domain-containing protein, partial [Phycisphaerae bacterium]|nr:autotransporter outer membrane beta-barrel domain-containing protein [Phycisphaerae bacterium]